MDRTSVWVKRRGTSGSGPSVRIHADPDCRALQRANSVREVQRHKLPDDWEDCALCADTPAEGGGVPEGEDPQARRRRLAETDPADLDL